LTPTPQDLAGAVLTVDLAALRDNWRRLARLGGAAQCGAAVKGDAYGLGVGPVARALWQAGCRSFFVARPAEGGELREILPDAVIYVLDGLMPGQASYYAAHNLRPALISLAEARAWAAHGQAAGVRLPCALHADTGINRLGFTRDEFDALLADRALLDSLNVTLLMSHLACADEPAHPMNARQREAFATRRAKLPGVPASLANSSGIFLGSGYAHELTRPGLALYGGNPTPDAPNPMQPVAVLEARILQVKTVAPGETVGYGGSWQAQRETRVAILGAGYRDGVPRALSSRLPGGGPAQVAVAGRRCPVIGRVSMDVMAIDVSGLPAGSAQIGGRAELFGHHIAIDEAATWAGTISYELLTRLGSRYARLYTGQESDISA
jgi:alanine racemase